MVSPGAKKEAAETLQRDYAVSERRACKLIDLARSTKRHQLKPYPLNEKLSVKLCELAEKKKRFGAPRLLIEITFKLKRRIFTEEL